MKKSNQRLLKISYEFIEQDSGEGRLERAFDVLFDIVLKAELDVPKPCGMPKRNKIFFSRESVFDNLV